MDIRTCINMLAGEVNSYLSLAKVSKVNEDKASCDIELPDGTELPEARLRPLLSNQGALLFLPKTGSQVIVGFLSPAEAVVLGYSEVEKIQFQEGKNGGLVIADKIADKLNKLENQLNQLKQILNAWTPVPSDGGATLKGAITSWSAQNLIPTQSKELQNSKISH